MSANTTTPAAVITLSHNQEIRVKGFSKYAQRITVGTIQGYARQYNECPVEAVERSRKFGHSLNPWTSQECACLTADYPGKAKALEAKAAATADAPEIEAGQIVEIEGLRYSVVILGERYSDPVAFKPAI